MSLVLKTDLSKQYMGKLSDEIVKWVAATALDVQTNAIELAPVKTGTLRRSIRVQHISGLEAWIGSKLDYARFVHDGTRRMAARPYLLQGMMLAEAAAAVRLANIARALNG